MTITETGACDLMEEHFRKSLGADYSKLFKEKPVIKKESSDLSKDVPENMDVDHVKTFKDDLDMSGYTGLRSPLIPPSSTSINICIFQCNTTYFQLRTISPKLLVKHGPSYKQRQRKRKRRVLQVPLLFPKNQSHSSFSPCRAPNVAARNLQVINLQRDKFAWRKTVQWRDESWIPGPQSAEQGET